MRHRPTPRHPPTPRLAAGAVPVGKTAFVAGGTSGINLGIKTVADIDLLGTFDVLRAAYGLLRKPGASIINISAPQSTLPSVAQVHVCAAKAGVDMVTRVLELEWDAAGIRVNAIVPGPIEGTEGMVRPPRRPPRS